MGLRSRPIFPGVYVIRSGSEEILATRNLTPGKRFYGEQLLDVKDVEYRSWNPYRSKLAAAILRGLNELPLCDGDKVLYLGVASGTTCSHISDIIGEDGHIWGVEFASRPIRDFIQNLTNTRKNISPIFGDARLPGFYAALVPKVDIIYSDVAQPNQAEIVVKNARVFLKKSGWVMMAIKSRSINVVRTPTEVFKNEIEKLDEERFEIKEFLELDPYEKDHAFVVARSSH